jgi:formyl-CoA transferase/succinyl-CoA--D-citramalate CoA-transferase
MPVAGRGSETGESQGPLDGITVLELGSFIAGPFAGQILGDLGADVIKIEAPGEGDPMRQWGVLINSDSLWWPSIARNKRSVCVDLRDPRGRDLVRRLISRCDIVLENFRPGRLAEWDMAYEELSPQNPQLVVVHVSGFGQTGPKARAAGFGSIGEAVGGLRFTTGDPNLPPSRAGVSLGDALAALFAVVGALAGLNVARTTGKGQEVDVAIYEAVAALMESSMADFELGGILRSRTGSVLPGVAPSNSYPTADGSDIVIAANADAVFVRLTEAMGQPQLAEDERFRTHVSRGRSMAVLDHLIADWTSKQDSGDLLDLLEEKGVPAGRIFTAEDMLNDLHYAARDMVLRRTSMQGWSVPMQGVVPKFSRTPGSVRTTGPALGEHTWPVLRDLIGLSVDEYAALSDDGVVFTQIGEAVVDDLTTRARPAGTRYGS